MTWKHLLQMMQKMCIRDSMNDDGTMNELAGEFNGMDRFEARKAVVKKLEEIGALVEIEKMTHSVGHSERTGEMCIRDRL